MEETFAPALLDRLAEADRGRRCVCRACARADSPLGDARE
ncbi:MAG: hypothetical protein ACX93N_07730 [Pseudohaliea sp.]